MSKTVPKISIIGDKKVGSEIVFSSENSVIQDNAKDVAYLWRFCDQSGKTIEECDNTQLKFPEVTYVWENKGSYKVELVLLVQVGESIPLQTFSETIDVEISDSQSDAAKYPDVGDEVSAAFEHHNRYIKSYKSWLTFASGVEKGKSKIEKEKTANDKKNIDVKTWHPHKVMLWKTIAGIIEQSRWNTDAIAPSEIYAALGVSKSSFKSEYSDFYDPEGPLAKNLGFKWAKYHITSDDLGNAQKRVVNDANEFINFGQKVLAYQFGYENDVKKLIAVIKGYRKTNFRNKKWASKFKLLSNPFLLDIRNEDYSTQVQILAGLFTNISRSDAGKIFLGELFANRHKEGALDPFHILYPPEGGGTGGPVISCKNRSKFFDENGKLNLESEDGRSLHSSFEKLLPELLVGALYYRQNHNDGRYNASQEHAETIFGKFYARVVSKYWKKSDLEKINGDEIERLKRDLSDRFSKVATDKIDSVDWSNEDTLKVTKFLVGHYVAHSTLYPQKDSHLPDAIKSSKSTLAVLKLGLIIPTLCTLVSKAVWRDKIDSFELTKLAFETVKLTGDVYHIAELAGKLSDEAVSYLKIFKFILKYGYTIDFVLLAWEVPSIKNEWQQNDYDAAYAATVEAGGMSLFPIGEGLVALGVISIPAWKILLASGIVTGIGAIWSYWADDKEVIKVIEACRFGRNWESSSMEYENPEKLEFLFKVNGKSNYVRQLAKFVVRGRPINLTKASLRNSTSPDDSLYTLKVEIDPPQGKEEIEPLREGGVFYFRPFFDGNFANILHRIELSQEEPSRVLLHPGSSGKTASVSDINQYFVEDFAPHASEKRRMTELMLENNAYTQILENVKLAPSGDSRFVDSKLKKLTIELSTPFAPMLLGAVPKHDRNGFLHWPSDTLLEVIYLPPGVDDRLQQEGLAPWESGIAHQPTLSREIIKVDNLEGAVNMDGNPMWAK